MSQIIADRPHLPVTFQVLRVFARKFPAITVADDDFRELIDK